MKRIVLLMMLIISMVCFGCKNDKVIDKPPTSPTDATTYLDVENLWAMYLKDMKTVKDSFTAGVFVSQQDSVQISLDVPPLPPIQLLTYSKDTPAGKFIIECGFYKDTLFSIDAMLEKKMSISYLMPHYLAITENIINMADNNANLFPFKAGYTSMVMYAKSLKEVNNDVAYQKFNGGGRSKYLKHLNECAKNYMSINEDNHYFAGMENWGERMYDPVIGCPIGVDPNGISKAIQVSFGSYEYSKFEAQLLITISSSWYSNVIHSDFKFRCRDY